MNHRGFFPAAIMSAQWSHLTEQERVQAIVVARCEGRYTARWYLEEPAQANSSGSPLRSTRWALEQPETSRLDDRILHLYASAQTVACEEDYVPFVIERYSPERAAWWWGLGRESRLKDLRVCGFCEAYERKRCRILGLTGPPTRIADLRLYLYEAKERERESSRAWLWGTQEGNNPGDDGASVQDAILRWECLRCTLCTDLAQMLLATALNRCKRSPTRVTPFTSASGLSVSSRG